MVKVDQKETGGCVSVSSAQICTYRPRGETREERKERKAKVKEAQRLMRANKKVNKELLKVTLPHAALLLLLLLLCCRCC